MNVLIVYGSTTGLTEIVSEEVEKGVLEGNPGLKVDRINVLDIENAQKTLEYKYVLFGSSTWDYGCLQYDFQDYFDELIKFELSGISYGVFGTGDKAYGDTYCMALKTIDEAVSKIGAKRIIENLDIESDLNDGELTKALEWGKHFATKIN